ncbi:MAG: hypothetical protein CM15mP89_1340 [Gammaproteobacteria bacterium]|nr:MAG: hypothetical protein CM15mP89_1340 [Gammaproteobacteria bacterium]
MDAQSHLLIAVIVLKYHEGLSGLNQHTQLLPEFPGQRFLQGFARFDLAAREFPQSALMRIRRAASDQHTTRVVDQDADRDSDGCHIRCGIQR